MDKRTARQRHHDLAAHKAAVLLGIDLLAKLKAQGAGFEELLEVVDLVTSHAAEWRALREV